MRGILIAALLALTACAAKPPSQSAAPAVPKTRVINAGCDWTPKLTFTSTDAKETKEGIIAYTLARQKNCPQLAGGGNAK